MQITQIRIENFKGLRDVTIPTSRFACLIGENNAGKSSVLQATALFFSGTALPRAHCFDPAENVRIAIDFDEVSQTDIDRLAEEHRAKIQAIIRNGKLTLVRAYGTEGKGALKYRTLQPNDKRFSSAALTDLLRGKKAGKALADAVVAKFPELAEKVTASSAKADVEAAISELAESLPDEQKTFGDADLPTGIDKSISAMLPEPIYIPAVKDLRDDIKTTESTPFGKVLGMLLRVIEPQLSQEKSLFENLNAKLNCIIGADGSARDDRLQPVKTIEETIERLVQDTFTTVKLRIEIPPPELKAVLSSAQIFANDGVDGSIDSKGDGLRRAIVFAILRAYVELSHTGLVADGSLTAADSRYLLLFEEPELYLHPKAQQILFDALRAFSQKHLVIVTTHSPGFFGPGATTTFVKLGKRRDASVAPKPYAVVHPIDLQDTNARDQFQLICYENNNIAFFADTVVLVEGDSDYIVLPHLARIIDPLWDFGHAPVRLARIGGKGNIRRYRDFFHRFDAHVLVVTDLDFVLGGEFGQIDPNADVRGLRDRLLGLVDKQIKKNGDLPEPNGERTKDAQARGDLRALWRRAKELHTEHKEGRATLDAVNSAVDEFFDWEKCWARRDLLKTPPTAEIQDHKRQLLDALRATGVFVWDKGAIEDYYPAGVMGESKPAKAQVFCNAVSTRNEALALCGGGHKCQRGILSTEFEAVFRTIFTWA